MNMTRYFLILILTLIAVSPLLAQDGGVITDPDEIPDDFVWSITRYSGTADDLVDVIGEDLQRGYLPVGFEADPDISLLLIQDDTIPFTRWRIHEFTNPTELEAEMNGFLVEGWLPMDIARTQNGIAALFIETEFAINGWRIVASEATDDALTQTIENLQNDGLTIWGASLDGEGIWLLAVREIGGVPRVTQYANYRDEPEQVRLAVNESLLAGWIPWGLSLAGGRVFVTYLR
ncbi:MAG: hypothetical protein EA383_01510 [Spirochaetaceae bacterium]|nr:MAG: hypothetical protein EA383_01510 [Spirochaetaceae bacterium]